MSDSQKQQRPGATPIKNPLLSASVTGLTFDDFPNKPLLLPAAPPIVHATVPAPVVTPSGLIAREHKSLVTLGSSSLDTENLDEINLNASNEDSQTSDITDPNPLLEQSNQGVNSDSILSQAASSFSALPSVASNVFSTFSKRITAISSRETTPTYDQYQQDFNSNTLAPQLDIQPTYTQQQYPQQGNLPQVPPPFYAPPQGGNYISGNSAILNQQDTHTSVAPPVEPPKFYTPAEIPPIPSASGAPPANLGGQNNFRFTSKKKLYAPIPGLSDQSQSPSTTLDPSTVSAPISYDASYGGNTLYQQSQYPTAEERKPGSGLFSKISNLAPAGVFQNITGLVQSAAGSLTQTIKTDSYQPTPAPVVDQQNNYFAGPPPPTNYFVPPSLSGHQTNPQTTLTTSEYTNTSQNTQPSSFFIGQQPEPTHFAPYDSNPSSQSANFFNPQPTTTTLPPAAVLFQSKAPSSTESSQTQIPFFNPTNLPPQVNPNPSFPPTSQPLRPNRPPSRPPSHPSSSYLPPNPNEQSVTTQSNPTEPALDTAPQIVFFDPTNYLPSSSQTSAITPTSLTSHPLPPTADHKIPPPASGHTSYRLQKGTKLYKNPLTPQETAPIQAINQPVHSFTAPPSFTAPQSVPVFANEPLKIVPLFAPTPVGELKSHPSFATPQSVPLFTSPVGELISSEPIQSISTFAPPPVADLISNKSVQSVPLFSSTVEEFKSIETTQSVPLFVPPVDEVKSKEEAKQNIPLVDPQVDEIKTEAPTQNQPLFESLLKEHKSNEPIHTVPLFAAAIEEKKLEELKTNELEHSVTTEVTKLLDSETENKVVNQVPKQDTHSQFVENKETQPIFEPIEPVIEDNSTEIQTEEIKDSLEQTIQKLSLTAESSPETKTLTLPPITTQGHTSNNPYRRGSATETTKPAVTQPTLANFFTPVAPGESGDLNFFATLPATEPCLANSNSGIDFFSEPSQDNKEISEPKGTLQAETTNFFNTELSSSGLDVKPDLIPFQPHTAIHPPITAFFPTLPTSLGLVPAVLEDKNNITKHLNESFVQGNVLPPIGFETFTQSEPSATVIPDNTTVQQETSSQTKQPEIVNRFSNYFNQTNQQQEIVKDPSTFFDSFPGQQVPQQQPQHPVEIIAPVAAANEEQRIQFFFNNPPPKDASAAGDLNYDLVHSGLGIKKLQQRSLTPISNLVEPPSSACSEFSEISNSTAGQKSIGANLSITGISEKSIEKEENKSIDNSVNLEQDSTATDTSTKHYEELPEEILKELRMANILSADKSASSSMASVSYKPAVKHWFFKRTISDKQLWIPFSHYDSALLETSLLMEDEDEKPNIVAVEGGRYDVNISERKKMSVYWESEPIEVRRCSWFYKAVDSKYVPYEEQTAEVLEKEYKQAADSGVWHKTIILGMGEQVVFHGPTVIVHFQQQQNSDAWGGTTKQTATRPRVVKRDLDDFNIEQGESQKVDHLLFMVHGIGSACDLKLRSVEEVVEDFRTIARQLVQSHYKNSTDLGLVGRVEVLPISWHSHLHSAEMGIDEKLRMITLESIPKLRNFTNDTLLDILFYTSPTFCQKIMNTIVSSMNTLYLKYRERHPEFNGGVSLAGHSLGSLILFDLLCHQNPIKESEEKNLENPDQFLTPSSSNTQMDSNQLEDKQISYTMGPAGTGQPFINYGQLIFQPKKFFALGSPIGMFVTIRGIDKLGLDFRLPTCPGFYNIFHPYDPVAYRIEALVNPDLSGVRPVLIPHHKGRKRMHLELKETMTRVSMDLKNRFLDKFKTTLDSVNIFGSTTKSTKEAEELMEKEVDKVIQMQMALEQQNNNQNSHVKLTSENESQNGTTSRQRTDSVSTAMSEEVVELDLPLGKLNDSKRVDYVLQEAPLEFINEYIFALSSHVCYWDSEDTILFVMKEIYSGLGISPDSQVPQQTMTIERPSSRNSLLPSS